MKKDVAEEKETRVRLEADLVKLQKYIIIEHTNEFKKVFRLAEFLHQDVSFIDARFDVNKDIFEARKMDVNEITTVKVTEKMVIVEDFDDDASEGETTKVSLSIATNP